LQCSEHVVKNSRSALINVKTLRAQSCTLPAMEGAMRTTRDAIAKNWLLCPEVEEKIDVRHSFSDCKKDHECKDRLPSHCPLYVERLVKQAVRSLR
jgi:hypothetical protein